MTREPGPSSPAAPPPDLFLVELRAAIGVPTDLSRMHDDLASSIVRLGECGVDIVRVGTYLLPEDARCLCLVRGVDKSTVALACDVAGLTAAPVYEAHSLSVGLSQHGPAEERP